ncbi:hypothetical protein A1D29_05955 [Pasteurellaceae bacterium Orientalotternb1]|nr:hypothetical protein A1D29_05955 [Pasteurellaceae bacterium Orientalotternb1]
MRYYPATLEQLEENGETYYLGTLRFSDNYAVFAQAETLDETLTELQSHLIGAVEFTIKNDERFPEPAPQQAGEILVLMPTLVEAKVLVHNERITRKLTKTELGKLVGFSPAEMQRLLNPWYKSGIDKLDQLFCVLDLKPQLSLV